MGVKNIGPITLEPGEEYDTGISWIGIICMQIENSGRNLMVNSDAQIFTDANIIYKGEETMSIDLSASGKDCMNKKETNGSIVLKNNKNASRRYRLLFR